MREEAVKPSQAVKPPQAAMPQQSRPPSDDDLQRCTMDPKDDSDRLHDWADELGCTTEELLSAMGESGRSLLDFSPSEQFQLDLEAQG